MDKYRHLVLYGGILCAFLFPSAVKAQFSSNALAGAESRLYYCFDDVRPFNNVAIDRCFQNALKASSLFVSASQITLANKVYFACNQVKCTLGRDLEPYGYTGYIYPVDNLYYRANYNINSDTNVLSGYILLALRNGEHPFCTGYSTESNTIISLPVNPPETYDLYVIVFDVENYTVSQEIDNIGYARGLPVVAQGADNQHVFILTAGMTNNSGSENLTWGNSQSVPTDGLIIGNNAFSWSLIFNNQTTTNHVSIVTTPAGDVANMVTPLTGLTTVFDNDTDQGGMSDYREWSLNNHNWYDNPADDDETTFKEPEQRPPLDPGAQVVDIGELTGEYLEWLVGNPGQGQTPGGGSPVFLPPAQLDGELEGGDIEGGDIDADDTKEDVEELFRQEFEDKGWMAAINAMTAENFDSQTLPSEIFHPVITVADFGQSTSMDLGQYDLDVTKFKNIVGTDKLNIIRLALKACLVIAFGWAMIKLVMSSVSGTKADD